MKPLFVLREYLSQHFPQDIRPQDECTCGAANHVRVQFFRVAGQPAAVIFPEGATLNCEAMQLALGMSGVEPLAEEELDAIYPNSELGHMQPFENPFGDSVFVDARLLVEKELVFCPRMFLGLDRRECFRVPLCDFLQLTHAQVIALAVTPLAEEAWAI